MSSRFAAILAAAAGEVTTYDDVGGTCAQGSSATVATLETFLVVTRGRRALVWVLDLTGEQIGVVS